MQDDEALGSPLSRACRLQQGAAAVGFDWPDASGPLAKVKEEIAELERETSEAELGDLLFAVVNLARKLGVDPDHALERANDKFRRRFAAVQRLAGTPGLGLGPASPPAPGGLWGGGERKREETGEGGRKRGENPSH